VAIETGKLWVDELRLDVGSESYISKRECL